MAVMCQQPFPEFPHDVGVLAFADEHNPPGVDVGHDGDIPVVLLRRCLVYPYASEPTQVHHVKVHPDLVLDDVVEDPPGHTHLPSRGCKGHLGHLLYRCLFEPPGVGDLGLCPRHLHLCDRTTAPALAPGYLGMDVADGFAQVLVSPFTILVVVYDYGDVAVRADARTVHIGKVHVQNLHTVIEPSLGGGDLPVLCLDTEDEPHSVVQRDLLACVPLRRRYHDLVLPVLRNHES